MGKASSIVFDLAGHPTATMAYAWSSPIKGGDKRRFYAVLHVLPITSPRRGIVGEHLARCHGKAERVVEFPIGDQSREEPPIRENGA